MTPLTLQNQLLLTIGHRKLLLRQSCWSRCTVLGLTYTSYGWGILIAAGGGAYYFAKRSINQDRQERADAEEKRRQAIHRLQMLPQDTPRAGGEAGKVPLSPESKYSASDPFKSRKGDRFS